MINKLTLKLDSRLDNGSAIADRLVRAAYVYDDNERARYIAEIGWEDWMADYIELDDPDDEPTEHQMAEIDEVLNLAFGLAHDHPLKTAWELANLDFLKRPNILAYLWTLSSAGRIALSTQSRTRRQKPLRSRNCWTTKIL